MTITVEIAWNRTTYVNETSRVRPNSGTLTFEYGRDQTTAMAPTVSGRGSLVLSNRDKRFSPNNASSPLYGNLKPSRPVRVRRTVGANTYTLFVGHTDDNPINPNPNSKDVTISLIDSLADLRGNNITTPLYRDIHTGTAIGYILDAAGWPLTSRDLDRGATIIPWFWEDNTDALTALEKIIRSEGPPALLTINENGYITFKDRHHRLLDAASLTSQGTWRASGSVEPIMHREGFSYDEAWRNIVNTGTQTVDQRTIQPGQEVWRSEDTVSLIAGEVKLITATASDPFYNAVTPVAGTDWTEVSGSTVTAVLFRDSGISTTIRLSAPGAAVIRDMRLMAKPVTVARQIQVSARDGVSIDDYGSRSYPGDLPWCSADDAQSVLSLTVAFRAHPQPIVQARFMVGRSTIKADKILARDLSDRITLVEPETSTNRDFFVETIGHELTGEHDHAVTFGLEATPTNLTPVFQLDTAGSGADQGYLGNPFINVANFLILDLDVSGHRASEGIAAA